MSVAVNFDCRYSHTEANLPHLQAVMARIDESYHLRLAKEAAENEEVPV